MIRLTGLLLTIVIVHIVKKNRGSAHVVMFFLMTTQVVNALFHIFFSFYFLDFSPGAITATLLYLPVNYLIFRAAFHEGYLRNASELLLIFFAAILTFSLFELVGPIVIGYSILLMPFYYFVINKIKVRAIEK